MEGRRNLFLYKDFMRKQIQLKISHEVDDIWLRVNYH